MPSGVYQRNESHREICRRANLGRAPWNKGRKLGVAYAGVFNPPHPKLRFALLNGMTLCLSCHRKIHRLHKTMLGG